MKEETKGHLRVVGQEPEKGGPSRLVSASDIVKAAAAEGDADEGAAEARLRTLEQRRAQWLAEPIVDPLTGVEYPADPDGLAQAWEASSALQKTLGAYRDMLKMRAEDAAPVGEDGLPAERTRYVRGRMYEVKVEQDLSTFKPTELKGLYLELQGLKEVADALDFLAWLATWAQPDEDDADGPRGKLESLDHAALVHQLLGIGERARELVTAERAVGREYGLQLLRVEKVGVVKAELKKARKAAGDERLEYVLGRLQDAEARPTDRARIAVKRLEGSR